MIGTGRRGVDSMVGGDDQPVVWCKSRDDLRQGGVHRFQAAGEAVHVVAVSPNHVEIDQIREQQSLGEVGPRRPPSKQIEDESQVLIVRNHFDLGGHSSSREDLADLAQCEHGYTSLVK